MTDDFKDVKAGRELDAIIADRIFGKPFTHPDHSVCGYGTDGCLFGGNCHFSTEIRAAWLVVEKMREMGGKVFIATDPMDENLWNISFEYKTAEAKKIYYAEGPTVPFTICLASLGAWGEGVLEINVSRANEFSL